MTARAGQRAFSWLLSQTAKQQTAKACRRAPEQQGSSSTTAATSAAHQRRRWWGAQCAGGHLALAGGAVQQQWQQWNCPARSVLQQQHGAGGSGAHSHHLQLRLLSSSHASLAAAAAQPQMEEEEDDDEDDDDDDDESSSVEQQLPGMLLPRKAFSAPDSNIHQRINQAGGSVSLEEFKEEGKILSSFYQEGVHGGLGLRFRRKVPLFQVIEFHASGTAVEQYKPRTPQELGLHPRDVTLFAPLSRLAAPQRATIVVHDGKILVRTEVVKAIVTSDKAVLIKGRRHQDTQKLSQAILAANDQRLMAIALSEQQQQQLRALSGPRGAGIGSGGCGRAAAAAEVLSESHTPAFVRHGGALGGGWRGTALKGTSSGSGHGQGARVVGGGDLASMPFFMLVVEVLLDATAEFFSTKVQHLHWMLESLTADIRQPGQPQGALDKAHQLIPIQKFLTSVKNDVKETAEAIKAVLDDTHTLAELCESWHESQRQYSRRAAAELQQRALRLGGEDDDDDGAGTSSMIAGHAPQRRASAPGQGPGHHMRMLTEMLESYHREIESLEGSINEAEEDLDNTRSMWHTQLDVSRNHIIMVNLWLSMANISCMATTIVPAFFGMNLSSGISDSDPALFYTVCGCSLLLAALSYPAARYWYKHNYRKATHNEAFERRMLRMLLVQNIEEIELLITAVRRHRHEFMDRKRFKALLGEVLGNRFMAPAQVDLLWQAFDRDRDGFLEEAELLRPLNTFHTSGNGAGQHSGPTSSLLLHPASLSALEDRHDDALLSAQLGKLAQAELAIAGVSGGSDGSSRSSRRGSNARRGSSTSSGGGRGSHTATAATAGQPAATAAWENEWGGPFGSGGEGEGGQLGGKEAWRWRRRWGRNRKRQQAVADGAPPDAQGGEQQAAQQSPKQKHAYPGSWMEDERFNWD